jgi:hypothetical protein
MNMEINLNTSGIGLGYTMNSSFSINGTVSVPVEETPETTAIQQIQEHLNSIKEIFFAEDYDDKTMGFIIEDHIIAIQEILDDYRL